MRDWRHPLESAGPTKQTPSLWQALLGFIVFSVIAGILCTVAITPAIAMSGVTLSQTVGIFQGLPGAIQIGQLPERNRIFANGASGPVQIATVYDQNREADSWDKISPYLKAAAIDGEDKDYYSHGGVDVSALVRAAASNVGSGSVQSGASTIAMQVVRNIQTQNALQLKTVAERKAAYKVATEDTLPRKLKEMRLAIGIEKAYTKKQVLNAYLNIANFGGNNYGVEAAAQAYFSTTALKVTPEQAASLIAIVQEPSARSLGNKANYKANEIRRNFILGRMYHEGDITKAQLDEGIKTPVDDKFLKPSSVQSGCLSASVSYRWICDYTVNDVDNLTQLGPTKKAREAAWALGGYDVYTTFNLDLQSSASDILASLVPASETRFNLGGAVTTVQPGTGKILVMAENKTYDDTLNGGGYTTTAVNFNVDRDNGGSIGFQPGSAYKIFTLIDWLKNGHKLTDTFNASLTTMPMSSFTACGQKLGGAPYKFKNDEKSEQGSTTVTSATARSINSVFLQMASKLDLCEIRDVAESLGVHNASGRPLSDLPSCIIGGCDNTLAPITLAAVYAAVADQGLFCSAVAVEKLIGPNGKDLGGQNANCHQAIPANVANTAAFALQGVMKGGTGSSANPNDGTAFMGKTGTTNDSLHTWIVASSTRAASAVWIGNISGTQQLRKISVGGTQAALLRHKVFKAIMRAVDAKVGTAAPFAAPDPALVKGGRSMGSPPGYGTRPPAAAPAQPPAPVVTVPPVVTP